MPPPPMIAPLKQLERLFGESVLPRISYAQFNESCRRFRSSVAASPVSEKAEHWKLRKIMVGEDSGQKLTDLGNQ